MFGPLSSPFCHWNSPQSKHSLWNASQTGSRSFGDIMPWVYVFIFVLRVTALLLDCNMVMYQCSIFIVVSFHFLRTMGLYQQLTWRFRSHLYICFLNHKVEFTLGGISFWVSPEYFGTGEGRWFFYMNMMNSNDPDTWNGGLYKSGQRRLRYIRHQNLHILYIYLFMTTSPAEFPLHLHISLELFFNSHYSQSFFYCCNTIFSLFCFWIYLSQQRQYNKRK